MPAGPVSVPAILGLALATVATLLLGILPGNTLWLAQYAGSTTMIEDARQQCIAHPDNCRQTQVPMERR